MTPPERRDERDTSSVTRREGQIMEILYRLGEASVADIMERLPRSPTAGAVRRMLNLLHGKGAIEYRHEGAKKIYRPTTERVAAGEKALRRVVETFFAGSAARTMACLFRASDMKLPRDEKKALLDLIEKAKGRGK